MVSDLSYVYKHEQEQENYDLHEGLRLTTSLIIDQDLSLLQKKCQICCLFGSH